MPFAWMARPMLVGSIPSSKVTPTRFVTIRRFRSVGGSPSR